MTPSHECWVSIHCSFLLSGPDSPEHFSGAIGGGIIAVIVIAALMAAAVPAAAAAMYAKKR